jgi:superfamily I DNA and RNA helicase
MVSFSGRVSTAILSINLKGKKAAFVFIIAATAMNAVAKARNLKFFIWV